MNDLTLVLRFATLIATKTDLPELELPSMLIAQGWQLRTRYYGR